MNKNKTINKKIYIIGNVASGKTTLAKHLSKKLNIDYYSLDKVVWDDENNHTKRKDQERDSLFKNIIKKDKWIIEDVGRTCFNLGREKADVIYFFNLKKTTIYFRIIKRWLKQKLKLEKYDYKPTLLSLKETFDWAQNYKTDKLKELSKYKDKLIILTEKDLKRMYKEE